MRFWVSVDCSNAAFEDAGELPRILRGLADRLEGDAGILEREGFSEEYANPVRPQRIPLRDINGNRVGFANIGEGSDG